MLAVWVLKDWLGKCRESSWFITLYQANKKGANRFVRALLFCQYNLRQRSTYKGVAGVCTADEVDDEDGVVA
jgi:hypothetical protein